MGVYTLRSSTSLFERSRAMSEGWDGDMQDHTIDGVRGVPTDNILSKTEKVSPDDIVYRLRICCKSHTFNATLMRSAADEIESLRKARDSLKEELNSLKEDFSVAVDDLGGALITIDCLSANLKALKSGGGGDV